MCATLKGVLRLASLVEESIVDGPGLRLAVFTQGCPHHCPGCHNPETHNPAGGRDMELAEILRLYKQNPLLSGITFSGGEPFMQPGPLAELAREIHKQGGDVVTYTGFWFEDLVHPSRLRQSSPLLQETDLLVDGPFIRKLKDLNLHFRGSSNQRLLNKKARKEILARMRRLADCGDSQTFLKIAV